MRIVSSALGMQRLAKQWQRAGVRVGFVPTMGYLHLYWSRRTADVCWTPSSAWRLVRWDTWLEAALLLCRTTFWPRNAKWWNLVPWYKIRRAPTDSRPFASQEYAEGIGQVRARTLEHSCRELEVLPGSVARGFGCEMDCAFRWFELRQPLQHRAFQESM